MVATPTNDPAGRPSATDLDDLDIAAQLAKEMSPRFARLSPQDRAALLRELIPTTAEVAEGWVRAACVAKRIPFDAPVSGEEWLGGPVVVMRNLRLLAESWERVADGRMPIEGLPYRERADGLTEIDVFPAGRFDGLLFSGFRCTVLVKRDGGPLAAPDAPEGKCCLVLGAGNVSSIPAMDALHKLFVEGKTVVLKMNPVNEWAGPFIERAFAALVSRGFLEVVYGGAEAGDLLCKHPAIDEVHITGSDRTHDLIVWGPPGPERDRRKAANDPLLKKPVTSELGNVSPVAIVPGPYSGKQLRFMAKNVASMVTNNASFNCNAAKMLVASAGWPQRAEFMGLLAEALARTPPRAAYYPGAHERYRSLTEGRTLTGTGGAGPGELPWTIVEGLDPSDAKEPFFSTEPFCAVLGETALPPSEPEEFLWTMTHFCNARLWGTLNASVIVHPSTAKRHADALERAVTALDYGTVAINHWPALGYGFVSPPWGGAPGATLADVKSGIGWVHNTFMLRNVVKSVIRGPLTVSPKPAWFADNRRCHEIGRRLTAFEAAPSWAKLPGVVMTALRG